MPVLHTYRKKEGYYVLAGVNGRIVTYRLSTSGSRQLLDHGIDDGDKLSWAMLLELVRQGDAYTSSTGEDEDLSGWTQLGLLFDVQENEPSASDLVPLCDCGSMEGLHIAVHAETRAATLQCSECRKTKRADFDVSVPIYLINSPSAFDLLLGRTGFIPDETVTIYRDLLNSNLAAKWQKRVLPKAKEVQNELFAQTDDPQQELL